MSITEKDSVIETVNRLFINTDNRDWQKVMMLFTSSVVFDMTSVAGGRPSIITPQEIVNGWDKGLKSLKAVHHQTGNFIVDITHNEATVFCYGVAWHYLPNKSNWNTKTFVGSYDFHLMKQDGEWKIDRFKFNLKFTDGNLELGKEVQTHKSSPGRRSSSDEAA